MLSVLIARQAEHQMFHRALGRQPGDFFELGFQAESAGDDLRGLARARPKDWLIWNRTGCCKLAQALGGLAHSFHAFAGERAGARHHGRRMDRHASGQCHDASDKDSWSRSVACGVSSRSCIVAPVIEEQREYALIDLVALFAQLR